MNELPEKMLDEMLRRDFAGAFADDDGFTASVMRALPARPQQRPWLVPAAAITGALLAWLALLPSPFLQQATHEWLSGDIGSSLAVLLALLLGVGLLGCGWALEEA